MNTAPEPPAITISPGFTVTPPTTIGALVAYSATRPRAVEATAARANTGNPMPRALSMSRAAPSTTTPAIPWTLAAFDRMPPQPAASARRRCSMTMTSPAWAASVAAVHS